MPDILANGVRLYFEETGSGRPILVIHGTSSSARLWGDALVGLAGLGRVIAYDRRGCTRSERPHPYEVTSVHHHGDDAASLLRGLAATPAVVIGRSYGGETALDLALRYPGTVSALVLLEPAILSLSPSAAAFVDPLVRRVLEATVHDPGSVAEVFLRAVAGDETWEAFPPALKDMFTENGPAIAAELRGGFLDASPEDLGTIDVPTLIVSSEASPQPFRDACDALAAAIPGSRTALVPGGHLISPGLPEVLDFVGDVLAAGRTGAA
jgi:pimeloyl-ACP methyl ester carboxylesterase